MSHKKKKTKKKSIKTCTHVHDVGEEITWDQRIPVDYLIAHSKYACPDQLQMHVYTVEPR